MAKKPAKKPKIKGKKEEKWVPPWMEKKEKASKKKQG